MSPTGSATGSPGSGPEREADLAPNEGSTRPSLPQGQAAGVFSAGPADPAPATTADAAPALPLEQVLWSAGPATPTVVERARDLLLWAIPAVGKFPRSLRFTLGERLERRLYDVLEGLVRAQFAARNAKAGILEVVNVHLAVLRHEVRIAHDLRAMTRRQVEHAARLVDAVGREVGAWRRSIP